MVYPYAPPDFLHNQSADEIHRRMLDALPGDMDKSENQIPWDFTRPAALEKAEFVGYELNEAIKIAFPQWAKDEWLDLHAQGEGLERRPANKATGILTVNGLPGTRIAAGFQFATQANLAPSVIFYATEETTLDNGGFTLSDTASLGIIRLALKKERKKPLLLTLQAAEQSGLGELLLLDGTTILERYTFDVSDGANQTKSLFEALNDSPSAYFHVSKLTDSDKPLEPVSHAAIGTNIPIAAVEGGLSGNVPAGAIQFMVKPDSGITYLTNRLATSGGTAQESDGELRERVLDTIRRGISYTGCDADYVRWAKEVSGVGQVVVDPEWDDPALPENFHWEDENGRRRCAGAVRLFVTDANGLPANQQILEAVYDRIIRPENRSQRKAPIGAKLTVSAPVPLYIDIEASVTLTQSERMEIVTSRFKTNLDEYWLQASTENDTFDIQSGMAKNYVKYVYVGATLAETEGIANYDHNSLTLNGGTEDILIPVGAFPVTGEVFLYG